MFAYSLGECANSLVMNGIFGFAMLFYTKSLGLDPKLAGLVMIRAYIDAFNYNSIIHHSFPMTIRIDF